MDGAPDGRLSFTNMMPTLELVNDNGHRLMTNGGAPRIKVEGLTASWMHVRKKTLSFRLSIIYRTKRNLF